MARGSISLVVAGEAVIARQSLRMARLTVTSPSVVNWECMGTVKTGRQPPLSRVAFGTIGAEQPLVKIWVCMAASALGRGAFESDGPTGVFLVAFRTVHLEVGAGELETGL